jgi:hypothetical protein
MDAERCGSAAEVMVILCERLLNVDLFKFADGFGQKDAAVEHLFDESFHLLSHVCRGGGLQLIRQFLSRQ